MTHEPDVGSRTLATRARRGRGLRPEPSAVPPRAMPQRPLGDEAPSCTSDCGPFRSVARLSAWLGIAVGLVVAAGGASAEQADRPAAPLRTGRAFRGALANTMTATWKNVGLRYIARRLAEVQRTAVLIDRRVDPSRKLEVEVTRQSVSETLATVAANVSAQVRVVGNVLYVGPPAGAARVRTLVQLRSDELFDRSTGISEKRRFELLKKRTVRWNDLDRPAAILSRIAAGYDLTISGLERIGHDLWAEATLPDATAPEALSLVLIQFGLTFSWTDGATGIRLVPVPEDVAVEREFVPRGMTAREAMQRLQQAMPTVQASVHGPKLAVQGTVEELEAAEDVVRPGTRRAARPRRPKGPVPLARQTFTLTKKNVPVSALMAKLGKAGVIFDYDEKALLAAGIDLNREVDVDVTNVPAEEFFHAIFAPLGLRFTVQHATVSLAPRK